MGDRDGRDRSRRRRRRDVGRSHQQASASVSLMPREGEGRGHDRRRPRSSENYGPRGHVERGRSAPRNEHEEIERDAFAPVHTDEHDMDDGDRRGRSPSRAAPEVAVDSLQEYIKAKCPFTPDQELLGSALDRLRRAGISHENQLRHVTEEMLQDICRGWAMLQGCLATVEWGLAA